MKPILLSLCLFVALCNLRFMDKEQLQQHHEHISLDQQPIIVHIIPHSHDDVGWLKTVEQYFYGLRNDIQWANVKYIIDSYVEELQKDPNRKFIQVETKFFKMWWDKQTLEKQNIVKQLVASKQLQFISGGWCMNDEATTYYEDIIDQMTLGHKFLLETFNVVPTIGWQIDPFGHQNSQAALSYQMGFNAWFFARIDYEDKEQRLESKNMETIMIPPATGVEYPIFTHVQYYHYEAPSGFNFDANRDTDAIVDDVNSKSYNLQQKADKLVEYFRAQSNHYQKQLIPYRYQHLMHTFGSDFQWSNAKIFYENLDKLINYINPRGNLYNVSFKYSTPEEYIQEINKQNLTYSTKQDDFFPYSDRKNAFWTGYFTSRVAIKGYVKRLGRQAQTYRKFFALAYYQQLVNPVYYFNITRAIYELNDALAICQHHDAVTGTEQQHVNDDYLQILYSAEQSIQQMSKQLLPEIINNYTQFEICEYNNTAASCSNVYNALKSNKTVYVTLIDGKVKQENQTEIIRIKVPNLKYLIKDEQNNTIYGDVDCTSGFQDCDLYFKFQIPKNNVFQSFVINSVQVNESASEIKLTTNPFPYTEDTLIKLNSTNQFKLKYAYYKAYQGRDQPEGAYIFRIENNSSKNIYGNVSYVSIGYGRIMSMFRIVRTYTKTVVKNFYHDIDTFDIQTFVDEIPVADEIGKDIVMLVEVPNFNNNNTFYTDSNGLQFQERILNHRPQYNWSQHEPITGNYYPINSAIYIKEGENCVALLNDRAQGGSSLQNGQIEVMIHRRLLLDDYRGVGEALNEVDDKGRGLTQFIQHKLAFFNQKNSPNKIRKLQYFLDQYPLVFFDFSDYPRQIPKIDWFLPFEGFSIEPMMEYGDNLLKFNYQIWNENQLLLRIQNLQEVYSMKIDKLEFKGEAIRKTLTGNQNWNDWKQNSLKWNYEKPQNSIDEDFDDILYPLQIHTYLINKNDNLIK